MRFQLHEALLMYLAIKAFLKRLWRPPGVSLREDPGISGLRIPSAALSQTPWMLWQWQIIQEDGLLLTRKSSSWEISLRPSVP